MRIFLAAVLLAAALPAAAQDAGQQHRCWLGNMGYSPGATMRAGNSVMVCTPEFGWEATDQWAAGCVANGDFYGVGAIDNGPNSQAMKAQCRRDGLWEPVE